MKTAVVIPAFNEETRIGGVLRAVVAAPGVAEIVVVSDGSRDGTAGVARQFSAARVLELPENRGKGAAMQFGALATDAELILFLDADLIGLRPEHVTDLLQPVLAGEAEMTVGVFRGGRLATDISHFLVSYISGQRALARDLFHSVPGLNHSRSGVETAITKYVKARGHRVRNVAMNGVTHPMKEEKLGMLPGVKARLKMYWEIGRSLTNGHEPGEEYVEVHHGDTERLAG